MLLMYGQSRRNQIGRSQKNTGGQSVADEVPSAPGRSMRDGCRVGYPPSLRLIDAERRVADIRIRTELHDETPKRILTTRALHTTVKRIVPLADLTSR